VARTATLSSAADLYGSGSAEYDAVAAAWSAVSVA
jgi:Zn-dependent metalloprotease